MPILHITLIKCTKSLAGISKRNHVRSIRCNEKKKTKKPGEEQRKAERAKVTC